jgi:hypothetical protein
MRHQIAVVRFLNYFFELEQYNTKFTSRELDLMRVAGLVHDGRKSGEQDDYNRSKYTKFDHPIKMANVIRSYNGQYLSHDELEFIARCIESHMGQWATDKKSSTVLPRPEDVYQHFVHLADYLASRKDITIAFENVERVKPQEQAANLNEYKMTSGAFAGKTIPEIAKIRPNYLTWAIENHPNETVRTLAKQFLETQEDEI